MLQRVSTALFAMALAFSVLARCEAQSLKVPPEIAEKNLIKRADAVVPPLAKAAHVSGKVLIQISISPQGDVTSWKVVSGHPILIQAALDAVKQWKYRPFLENGQPVPAMTQVEITVSSGGSDEAPGVRDKYFAAQGECRRLLNERKYPEAEKTCAEAVRLSNDLAPDVVLERSEARSLLGHSLLMQGRVREAMPLYEEALKLDQGYRHPDDADLASDYANLGRAYFVAGNLDKADPLYEKSVETFRAAIVALPSMKDNYRRRLKNTLSEYARLKRAEGHPEEAEKLEQEAAKL